MSKQISFVIIVGALIVALPIILYRTTNSKSIPQENINNVSIENGVQVIVLKAKGGYQPRVSTAKAGAPTILRLDTKGTFDCSASIRIPAIGVQKILPSTGTTDFDLGIQKAGVFEGSCGMGMYPFQINFE